MEIKTLSRWLMFALVVNGLLMLSSISTLMIFRTSVRNYKPTFPVSESNILERVSLTTYEFLTNYHARIEQKYSSDDSFPPVVQFPFSVYGGFAGDRLIYNHVEYGPNDFISVNDETYQIISIDFARQRIYCIDSKGAALVCVAGPGPDARPAGHRTGPDADKPHDGIIQEE